MKKIIIILSAILLVLLFLIFFSCSSIVSVKDNEEDEKEEIITPPAAPADSNALSASYCRIIISWTDNSNNESSFVIQRSASADFVGYTEFTTGSNATSYSDRDNLSSNTRYYYRVRAVNSAGNSAYTDTANAVTLNTVPVPLSNPIIADHTVVNILRNGNLPVVAIQNAKTSLHIGYGHTSHGSQITDGMGGLVAFANGSGLNGAYTANQNLFNWNRGGSGGALDLREGDGYGSGALNLDCGYYPNWVNATRAYLNDPANYQVNVIIWSWCGQAAGYDEEGMINTYLAPMNQLEQDYPDIKFVYMTCHLNGGGPAGNLHLRDQQIRDYCIANNKILFDFEDIECYDPDGIINYNNFNADDGCYYDANLDGIRESNWAINWQGTHAVNTYWYDCGSAHSQALNANMKAYAAWWLWCRLAGWGG